MDQQRILVEVTINSSPTEALPFGDFSMNWKGVANINGNEVPTMQGTLQTVANSEGKLQFKFYNGADNQFSFSEAANVILDNSEGTSGIAKTATHRSEQNADFHSEFAVAYNATHFLRGKDTDNDGTPDAQQCNDRINMDENVWRYNLYNQIDGSRVNINSGFPFVTTINNEQVNGHISYWGMWLPETVNKSQVASITRQDFSDSQNNLNYDVVHTPGRLIKRSKSVIPLSDLDGSHFIYWQNAEFLVEYTHDLTLNDGTAVASEGFYSIASIAFTQGQREVTTITPDKLTDNFLNFYSDSLRGSVAYDKNENPTHIAAFTEETISGSDSTLFGSNNQVTLACYSNCLKSILTSSQLQSDGDTPYLTDSNDPDAPAALYTFSLGDLTLRDMQGNPVAMADGQSPVSGGRHAWGIQTSAMVLQGTTLGSPWDTWNQDVSYIWETGPNDWNKMTFIRQQGISDLIQFERPLHFLYTHSNENDRNLIENAISEYAGQSVILEYGGQGDLWGFPEVKSSNQRHTRGFSIKDETVLTNTSGNYVVKATEMEKRMRELNVTACTQGASNLSLNNALDITLPTASDITPVTFSLTDKPVVTDSPKVVGGEL